MTSAYVKANVDQVTKYLEALSHNFLKEVPSKLQVKYKTGVCFSFNLGCHSIQLDVEKDFLS